jgi:2-polyprenyl-3-methyl-5-hydroxy-6-metoxy-1,4-benzoquinol methylase
MENNNKLKKFYNSAYEIGEENVFSFFDPVTKKKISEDYSFVLNLLDWSGKEVIDVGCGSGGFSRLISQSGALSVHGIDYSDVAIKLANAETHPESVKFEVADITDIGAQIKKYDVVVSLGVIEHQDEPVEFLNNAKMLLKEGGQLIIACPHFLNPRGYVWMALSILLEVPMSLSDLHFLHPWDIAKMAKKIGMNIKNCGSVDHSVAYGSMLLKDYEKRLKNALSDKGLPTYHLEKYLIYLEELTKYLNDSGSPSVGIEGATAVYRLWSSDREGVNYE